MSESLSFIMNDFNDYVSMMIFSAAAGAGHVSAADALVAGFKKRGFNTIHIEVLKYSNAIFRKIYSDLYIELVNKRPELLGWVYNSLDQPWKYQKRRLALDRLNATRFIKLLKKEDPDIALCTHFLPAEILLYLKRKKELDIRLGIIITDFDAHAMWLYKDVDWYFVASEETKVYLTEVGIPVDSIHMTGIPIDPAFSEHLPKENARKLLNLDQGLTTILISAGGAGVGPMESIVDEVQRVENPIQIVVICGRNEELKELLMKKDYKNHPVKIVGYTKEMHKWMAASDLLIGKAGGLTSSEALASGLVMVIMNPVPGQEERNSDHFLEKGVAIRCNNLPTLNYKIDSLISNKMRLEMMRENIRSLAKPNSTEMITNIVLSN